MSTETKVIRIGKVNVTSDFKGWEWQGIELRTVVSVPPHQIISAVVCDGGLYLVYWYEETE